MLYPITTIIAIDQATGARVENGSGYVYALSDTARATPLSIFDLSGLPLPSNLLTTNSEALIPPFQVDGEWQVVFVSGDSEIILTSYLGLKEEAAASADAANEVAVKASNGEFKGAQGDSAYQVWLAEGNVGTVADYLAYIEGPPGKDGSNVLPTDEAITQAIQDTASSTRGALNATFASKGGVPEISDSARFSTAPTPLFVAHRGNPKLAPEESLTAFRYCVAAGVLAIELDVQFLVDGTLAVMHDTTVDRTTTTTGPVDGHSGVSWQTLEIDSAGLLPGSNIPWPVESPPLFEAVLREFGNKAMLWVGGNAPGVTPAMASLIEKTGVSKDTIVFSSFIEADVLEAISYGFHGRVLHNTVAEFDLPALAAAGVSAVGTGVESITQAFVDDVHANGMKIYPWDTHHAVIKDQMLALGCDGVSTDDTVYFQNRLERTTDAFSAQTYVAGMNGNRGTPTSGEFANGNEFGWPSTETATTIVRLGYLTPPDPSNYVLDFEMRRDGNPGAVYAAVCTEDDYTRWDRPGNADGYDFVIKTDGTFTGARVLNNQYEANLSGAFGLGTGFVANTWLPYRITVTPTTIRFERSDTGDGQTFNNSTYRPVPFFHFGRAAGVDAWFRNITVS